MEATSARSGNAVNASLLAALTLVAGGLAGCSGFEINEAICSKGEEPTWAVTSTAGAMCVRDGDMPRPGFARYPRGRVPVWINPPDGYAQRTADGEDRYNVNPNDPDYPWWDGVLAEHPEFGCAGASEPLVEVPMGPAGKASPEVVVLLNGVGNRCVRFEWPEDLGSVVRADLAVEETRGGPVWTSSGSGDRAARELLRVASETCLRVTATLQLKADDGRVRTYRLSQTRVRPTCDSR